MEQKTSQEDLRKKKSSLKLKNYDPYQKATLTTALNHLKATTVHSGSHYSDPSKICPCCGNNFDVQNYSFCCSPDAFTNYGVSYSSFFRLIKFLMLVLFINFLISGLVSFWKIDTIWDCTVNKDSCAYWLFPDEFKDAAGFTHFFALVNIIVIIMMKNVFYYFIKKLDFEIDLDVLAANDFTIFVEGVGKDMEDEDIKEYFRNLDGQTFEVIKINRIYRIKKSVQVVEEFMQIEKEKKSLVRKKKMTSNIKKQIEKCNKKLIKIKVKLDNIQKEFNDKKILRERFSGSAFLTFDTEKELNDVLEYFKPNLFWNSSKGIKVRRACSPPDVYWSNFGLNNSEKLYRRIISITISIFFIGICFYIILSINKLQISLNNDFQQNKAFLLSIAISLTITILNILLRIFLFKSTEMEHRETYSYHYTSIVGKMTLTLFANEALLILLSNYINDSPENLYSLGGVGKNMLVIMIVGVYINPLLIILDPGYFFLKLKRWYYKIRLGNEHHEYYQFEVNEVYENPVFDISEVHYISLKSMAIAVFYQSVIPWGMLLSIGGMFLNYLAWKWRFIYRSQIPKELDFSFTKGMMRYFDFTILLMAVGYLTWDILLMKGRISGYTIAMIVICGVEFILDHFGYILLLFKKDREFSPKKYSDIWKTFACDYDRLNPITQRVAYTTWLEKIGVLKEKTNKKSLENNYLANIYDYVASNNTYGNGSNNIYQKENPFINLTSISNENIVGMFNFYKIEQDSRKKVIKNRFKKLLYKKVKKVLKDNKSQLSNLIEDEENPLSKKFNGDINNEYTNEFMKDLEDTYRKNSLSVKNEDSPAFLEEFISSRKNSKFLNVDNLELNSEDEDFNIENKDKIIEIKSEIKLKNGNNEKNKNEIKYKIDLNISKKIKRSFDKKINNGYQKKYN